MVIKGIFFDLDDTLIHEEETEDRVMVEVAGPLLSAAGLAPEAIVPAVRAAARELWLRSGEHEYCRRIGTSSIEGLSGDYSGDDPHLRNLRRYVAEERYAERVWRAALEALGIEDSERLAEGLSRSYAAYRNERHVHVPGAAWVLRQLVGRYRLAMITNGAPRIQWGKVEGCGLKGFFAPIVVSGELGVGKPDPTIYRHALRLAGLEAGEVVMVGNSLSADIGGAQAVGVRAIWFNPKGTPLPPDVSPWRTVASLEEILQLVG